MPYSYKNQYPIDKLPERIRLSNGLTRTDSSTFTADEITDAGYVVVSTAPTYNDRTHKLTWDGSDWQVVELTTLEIQENTDLQWDVIRKQRDVQINAVDWKIMRYQSQVRLGFTTTTDTIANLDTYIQELRNITNQSDPYNVVWPSLTAESGDDATG